MSLFHRNNSFIFKRNGISLLLLTLILGGCFHDKDGGNDTNPNPGTQCAASAGSNGASTSDSADGFGQTVTLSGVLSIASTVIVDTDVNDILSAYDCNDFIADAQQIPNPVTLGGYVNRAGSGSSGRSSGTGDRYDYYTTNFVLGQVITLTISDYVSGIGGNDIRLSLVDSQGSTVDPSVGASGVKTITVSASGTYFIRVQAISGASNYILSVGLGATQTNNLGSNADLNANDNFVPGEVIVRFKDGGQSLAARQTLSQRASNIGMRAKAGAPGRSMLMTIDNQQQRGLAFNALGIIAKQPWRGNVTQRKRNTLDVIKALRRRADVKSARPNYIRKLLLEPYDEHYPKQWHYPFINLPRAWDVTTGNNVIVAVVDTGILLNHPDLPQSQRVAGYDFIRDPANAGDGDGIDDDPTDVGDGDPPAQPSSFHGTHVAGTIAAETAETVDESTEGVAGVAWGAKIMPLRVLGKQGGTDYDIEQAVLFAAGLPNDSGGVPTQPADIINLSLGGPMIDVPTDVYDRARNEGVIIIAAAGNSGANQLSYPASLDGVVSVSAVNLNRQRASYSNFGASVDVAAPGGDSGDLNGDGYADGVLSTLGSDASGALQLGYGFYQGTSMAAPHVAGVAALMKAVNSNMTPQDFDDLLASGGITEDLGTTGWDDYFGHGLIDAYKAVVAAGGIPPTRLAVAVVNPGALNFSFDQDTLSFRLNNGGDGTLTVDALEITYDGGGSQTWLGVNPPAAEGIGTYQVTVDRSGNFDPGTNVYTAAISITTNINTVTIPVIMLLSDPGSSTNGYHYIILVDTDTQATVAQVQGEVVNGVFSYQFTNVPAGIYKVVAGTDSDNDGFLCDAGETCGAYPSLGSISDLVVDPAQGDISGINFEASFNLVIKTNSMGGTLLPQVSPSDTQAASRRVYRRLDR